jgi:hypothetical protein
LPKKPSIMVIAMSSSGIYLMIIMVLPRLPLSLLFASVLTSLKQGRVYHHQMHCLMMVMMNILLTSLPLRIFSSAATISSQYW